MTVTTTLTLQRNCRHGQRHARLVGGWYPGTRREGFIQVPPQRTGKRQQRVQVPYQPLAGAVTGILPVNRRTESTDAGAVTAQSVGHRLSGSHDAPQVVHTEQPRTRAAGRHQTSAPPTTDGRYCMEHVGHISSVSTMTSRNKRTDSTSTQG